MCFVRICIIQSNLFINIVSIYQLHWIRDIFYNNISWSIFMCSSCGTSPELRYHTHRTHLYHHHVRFVYVHSFRTFGVLNYSQIQQKYPRFLKTMFNLANIITPIIPVTNIISIWFLFITIIITTPTSIFIFLTWVTDIIRTIRFNFLLTTLFIRVRLKVLLLKLCHECIWAVNIDMRLMYIK